MALCKQKGCDKEKVGGCHQQGDNAWLLFGGGFISDQLINRLGNSTPNLMAFISIVQGQLRYTLTHPPPPQCLNPVHSFAYLRTRVPNAPEHHKVMVTRHTQVLNHGGAVTQFSASEYGFAHSG